MQEGNNHEHNTYFQIVEHDSLRYEDAGKMVEHQTPGPGTEADLQGG